MGSEVWWSIGLGIAIGSVYGVSAYATHHLAFRFRDNRFAVLVFGGMLLRMVLLLVIVALVMALLPVHASSFLIALVALLLISLVVEVMTVLRRLRQTQ